MKICKGRTIFISLWQFAFVCLADIATFPLKAAAQSESLLIFDAVRIEYIDLDPLSSGDVQFRELSSLPSNNNSVLPLNDEVLTDSGALIESPVLYQESILQFEMDGGPYDPRLSEAYLSLGQIYQQLDDQERAIEALSNALHVNRINNGLFNVTQLSIVSELVESYLRYDDIAAANQQQEYLLFIMQKVYGPNNPVIIPSLLKYADWNLHASSLSLGYIPDTQALGLRVLPKVAEGFIRNLRNFDSQPLIQLNLASNAYKQALFLQRRHEAIAPNLEPYRLLKIEAEFQLTESNLNIPETEKKLAFTHLLLGNMLENYQTTTPNAQADFYFRTLREGQDALERRLDYLQSANFTDLDIVMAMVDLADWLLLNGRWSSAEQMYIKAYQFMDANQLEQVPGLMYPDLPVPIPSYVSTFYSRASSNIPADAALDYEGYIDVSFELSRLGNARDIEILSYTANTHEDTLRALRNMLRLTQFRLQLQDHEHYAENQYLVRYYFTPQPTPETAEESESVTE
jgi:tetratricopeptide (TPR) repeat protein